MALPAYDNFNRAALGSDWTQVGTCSHQIYNSTEVYASSGAGEGAIGWNVDTPNNDQYSKITITAISGAQDYPEIGSAVRVASSAVTYYGYYSSPTHRYLFKVVAGTWSQLGSSASGGVSVNDVLQIEAEGTTIRAKINGSADTGVGTSGSYSDNAIASGRAGICGFGWSDWTTVRGDTWEGGNLSAGDPTLTTSDNNASNWSDAISLTSAGSLVLSDTITFVDNYSGIAAPHFVTDPFTGDGALSSNWTRVSDATHTLSRFSGQCGGNDVGADCAYFWNADIFTNNQYSQIRIKSGLSSQTHYAAVWVRASGGSENANGYAFEFDGVDDCNFYKVEAGVWTALGTASSIVASADDVFKIVVIGTGSTFQLKAYKNGSEVKSYTTADTTFTSGAPGISVYDESINSVRFDDFEGGNVQSDSGLTLSVSDSNVSSWSDAIDLRLSGFLISDSNSSNWLDSLLSSSNHYHVVFDNEGSNWLDAITFSGSGFADLAIDDTNASNWNDVLGVLGSSGILVEDNVGVEFEDVFSTDEFSSFLFIENINYLSDIFETVLNYFISFSDDYNLLSDFGIEQVGINLEVSDTNTGSWSDDWNPLFVMPLAIDDSFDAFTDQFSGFEAWFFDFQDGFEFLETLSFYSDCWLDLITDTNESNWQDFVDSTYGLDLNDNFAYLEDEFIGNYFFGISFEETFEGYLVEYFSSAFGASGFGIHESLSFSDGLLYSLTDDAGSLAELYFLVSEPNIQEILEGTSLDNRLYITSTFVLDSLLVKYAFSMDNGTVLDRYMLNIDEVEVI